MTTNPAIAQLAADKRMLESRLRDLIATEVAAFQKVSGVNVTGVDVRMLSQRFIEGPRDYIVSGVTVGVELS